MDHPHQPSTLQTHLRPPIQRRHLPPDQLLRTTRPLIIQPQLTLTAPGTTLPHRTILHGPTDATTLLTVKDVPEIIIVKVIPGITTPPVIPTDLVGNHYILAEYF